MTKNLSKPPKTVDLHAEALADDWEDYDSDALVALAIDHLRETLDGAIYWEYTEIKYIHGSGKGVLRDAIYDELRYYKNAELIDNYYPSYQNKDIVVVVIGI